MQRIKNIQTRDCYYPIYMETVDNAFHNPDEFMPGYYFYDDEMECNIIGAPSCYIGPYDTLDVVCKAQYRHYQLVMSL